MFYSVDIKLQKNGQLQGWWT